MVVISVIKKFKKFKFNFFKWKNIFAKLFYIFNTHYKVVCFVSGGSSIASVVAGSKPTRSWDKPQFDDIAPRNVTAIVGQTAELNCYVKHPGDRVVSDIFMLHLPHIHCFFSCTSNRKSREEFSPTMHQFFRFFLTICRLFSTKILW